MTNRDSESAQASSYETEQEAARRRIMEEAFPRLMLLRSQLESAGFRIGGAILPAHLDPGPYDGADADPNQRAEIMGLLLTWGDRLSLIVDA